MYRSIFNNNFNLEFHTRKTDLCGTCAIFENIKATATPEQINNHESHINLKIEMRNQNASNKANKATVPVLCFVLQNVITLPQSNIGPIFYFSKLTTYNLTAKLLPTNQVYCAYWTEYTSRRSGNDIASALFEILARIFEEHNYTNLIIWNDSCVPQNRNSIMAFVKF